MTNKEIFSGCDDFLRDQQKNIGRLLRDTMKLYRHNGREYPSVTSIINPTGMSPFANAYAARGNIVHYIIRRYIETGAWIDWNKCPEIEEDVYVMERDRRNVRMQDVNYRGFFAEYGENFRFSKDSVEKRFFCEKYRYTGRPDAAGEYKGMWSAIEFKTIGTYKKKDVEAILMQLAAYSFGITGERGLVYGVCIPLNGKTQRGYSEPIVCPDLRPYFALFLERRMKLQELYGI